MAIETRRLLIEGLLLAGLALSINLAGNARVGLWDRDEPRYAVAVREMRERGDWVTPSFNGAPRYHKPILIYWLMGLATAGFGDNPFGDRFVSGVAGATTCLLTWWLGRAMVGPVGGRLAALMLATAPLMLVESKLATTDATLASFLLAAQACLWTLNRRESTRAALAFWAALALATLTKGPVGPALIAASGAATRWLGGPSPCWGRLRWRAGLAVFAAIVAPWFVAIGLGSGGDFYRFAVGVQMVRRISTPLEEHGGFPGFYLVGVVLTFYPWSALLPTAIRRAWGSRRESPEAAFLLGWVVGPLVVLELFRTKLIHYYLPSLPALAILAGWAVARAGAEGTRLFEGRAGRLSAGLLVGIGAAGGIGSVVGARFVPVELRGMMVGFGALIVGGMIASLVAFRRDRPVRAAGILVACWGTIGLAVGGAFFPAAEPYRLSRVVGEKLDGHATREGAAPVLVTYQEPGILYALHRKAPTMRTWDQIDGLLGVEPTLVAPVTPDQTLSLTWDGRFDVTLLEALDGFNLSKGKRQAIEFVRLRHRRRASVAARPVEQSQVK